MQPGLDVHGKPMGLEQHRACCSNGVAFDVQRAKAMQEWDKRNGFKSAGPVKEWESSRNLWNQAYGPEHPYVKHAQLVLEALCREQGVPVPDMPERQPDAKVNAKEDQRPAGPSERRLLAVKVAQSMKGLGLCGPGDLRRDPSGRCYNVGFRLGAGASGMLAVFSPDYVAVQWKRGGDSGRDVFNSGDDAVEYVRQKFVIGNEEAAAGVPRRVPKRRPKAAAPDGVIL